MEKEFTEIDALKVIRQSIEQTKESFRENGLFYLTTGWVVFIAAIINYGLIYFDIRKDTDVAWWALLVAALVPLGYVWFKNFSISFFGGEFDPDMTKSSLFYLWRGLSVLTWIVLIFDSRVRVNDTYHLIIPFTFMVSMLGLGAYVSGAILKFKPLLMGGFITIFLLVIATTDKDIKPNPEYGLLVLAAAVLCSFIIPGHMLRASK